MEIIDGLVSLPFLVNVSHRPQIHPRQIFTFLYKYTHDQSNAKIGPCFDISCPYESGGMNDLRCILRTLSIRILTEEIVGSIPHYLFRRAFHVLAPFFKQKCCSFQNVF